MRRRKTNVRIFLLIVFCLSLILISIGYSVLKQKVNIFGTATIIKKEEENKDYLVTYVIQNKWFTNGRYYYELIFTLLNNTQTTLDGWEINVKAPKDVNIVTYSNVNCEVKGSQIVFSNVTYNAQIPGKQSVSFELQLSTSDPYYEPTDITINGSNVIPPIDPIPPEEQEREVEIRFQEDNTWSSESYEYYQYSVVIKNVSEVAIHSWQFELGFDQESYIEQIWNGLATQQGNTITLQNSTYNGMIQPNSEISFGFILKTVQKNPNLIPINVILK